MGDLVRLDLKGRLGVVERATLAQRFEPGDPVYLVSNGCRMTVESVAGEFCVCVWHDDCGGPQRETYRASSLAPYKPPRRRRSPKGKP